MMTDGEGYYTSYGRPPTATEARLPNDLEVLKFQMDMLSMAMSKQSKQIEALLEIFKPRCFPGTASFLPSDYYPGIIY